MLGEFIKLQTPRGRGDISYMLHPQSLVDDLAWASITIYHRLSDLDNRNVFLTNLEAGKSKVKVGFGMRLLFSAWRWLSSLCVLIQPKERWKEGWREGWRDGWREEGRDTERASHWSLFPFL